MSSKSRRCEKRIPDDFNAKISPTINAAISAAMSKIMGIIIFFF